MPLGCDEVILSDEAEATLTALRRSRSKEAASIARRVEASRLRLKGDCQAGEVIPFPLGKPCKPLEARHSPLENLYCLDLPDFWRMLYTIVRVDGRRYAYVLEVVDHGQYDKWFPGSRGR